MLILPSKGSKRYLLNLEDMANNLCGLNEGNFIYPVPKKVMQEHLTQHKTLGQLSMLHVST